MDNKPNIETAVKDYGDKKINLIKIDIILTIALFIAAGLMLYSLYPKIKNSHFMGSYKNEDVEETTTTVSSNEDKIDIEELKSEKYVVYKVTNLTGKTKDITIRLNTYVGDSIENTLSYQASAIENESFFYAYFKKSDLKIYDKYEYIINSGNSIYSSLTDSIRVSTLDYDQSKYTFTNGSGNIINNLNIVILYYDSNKQIVDIEEKNKTLLENNQSYEMEVKKDYSYYDVYVNEAYSIRKES